MGENTEPYTTRPGDLQLLPSSRRTAFPALLGYHVRRPLEQWPKSVYNGHCSSKHPQCTFCLKDCPLHPGVAYRVVTWTYPEIAYIRVATPPFRLLRLRYSFERIRRRSPLSFIGSEVNRSGRPSSGHCNFLWISYCKGAE